ncbi:MAG: ATP-binding protein [Lachnospiraceae bacterium]
MEIIRGKIPCAKKVLIYGPEGIGKSTFAAQFPEPLFIDTEGSTKEMDVARTPEPSSWIMLLDQIAYVKQHPDICKTLVVDTIDWAEAMCIEHVCSKHQKDGLESFGYGSGYIYEKEEFGRFLNRLEEIVKSGIHIVLTAHAQMRKFEQPDEMGAYDRWELKLGKKTTSQISPLVKEWADMVLFTNYKTFSVAVDDKGKKHKAQGGTRVMYTSHHPCWDAKNRYGLPSEMPFDYAGIRHIIELEDGGKVQKFITPSTAEEKRAAAQKVKEEKAGQAEPADKKRASDDDRKGSMFMDNDPDKLPKALTDLMRGNGVSDWDIQNVVAAKGYYPSDTPIERYDEGFIQGVLIGAWPKVYEMIRMMREKQEIPFI